MNRHADLLRAIEDGLRQIARTVEPALRELSDSLRRSAAEFDHAVAEDFPGASGHDLLVVATATEAERDGAEYRDALKRLAAGLDRRWWLFGDDLARASHEDVDALKRQSTRVGVFEAARGAGEWSPRGAARRLLVAARQAARRRLHGAWLPETLPAEVRAAPLAAHQLAADQLERLVRAEARAALLGRATKGEREVLELMLDGHSIASAARELGISVEAGRQRVLSFRRRGNPT